MENKEGLKMTDDDIMDLNQSIRLKMMAALLSSGMPEAELGVISEKLIANPDLDIFDFVKGLMKDADSTALGRSRLKAEASAGNLAGQKELVAAFLAGAVVSDFQLGANAPAITVPVPELGEREYVEGEKDVGQLNIDMNVINAEIVKQANASVEEKED